MMIRTLSTCLLVAGLAACASGVKLNDVPVEDKSASAVQSGASVNAIGSGSSAGQNNVSGVLSDKASGAGAGPAGQNIVFFDYDSFTLKPEGRSVIENNAKFLQANKQSKAMLEGHTDERGGREYNLALGQKRAEAVRQALTLLGVSESQVEAVSFGKEKPMATGSDEAAMAKNRRVEFKY